MLRLLPLLLSILIVSPPVAATQSAPPSNTAFYAVSYIEVMPSSRMSAIAAFKTYRESAAKQGGFGRVELFEQVGRSGHFASVETWQDQKAFDAVAATAHKQLLDTLQPMRVSGFDQRPYKTLTVGSSRSADTRAVSVITHVDTSPAPQVPMLLERLADASRKEPGNIRFDVMQHSMRANHFTVVETWQSEQALEAHAAAAHTKQYREELQPMTGSPLDERIYKSVQ